MTETALKSLPAERLSAAAWDAREHARVLGPTKVGCAVLGNDGRVVAGCNVEHRFRSHDIHAEVNAIGAFVASGGDGIAAVLVAAERDRFTPCGACLDWIFEFGGPDCMVGWQTSRDAEPTFLTAGDLMPYYPT